MRKFKPPFLIEEPLPDEECDELNLPKPDTWKVIDDLHQVISTHKTKESAEKGHLAAILSHPY